MTTEIRMAFAHPSERAAATGGGDPVDRISVRDHIVDVEIGAFQAERGTTQRVCFNVVVEVAPQTGQVDDDVDRILSYDRITEAIAFELAAERLNLLETLAERIAERILLEPQALRVFVRIEKLDRGPGALGVEIVRSMASHETDPTAADALQPHANILYLSNDAIASDKLSDWIDAWATRDAPLVICVGLPDTQRPATEHAMTQRRIDLLAIEQNGWTLAARDMRCKVVSTRTELDWAMKNGQVCVWAPSKVTLDAVSGPTTPVTDTVALCQWFAAEMEAAHIHLIGVEELNGSGSQTPVTFEPVNAQTGRS